MRILHTAIREAADQGYSIPHDLKSSAPKTRFLTHEEETRLLLALKPMASQPPSIQRRQQDNLDLVIFLLDTGVRISEACALKWSDVDLNNHVLHVNRIKTNSKALLKMTDRVIELLTRKSGKTNDDHVFTKARGTGARGESGSAIRNAIKRAGLDGVSLHTFRHTFCSRLVQAGVPLSDVCFLAGHSSIAITHQYYSHLDVNRSNDRAIKVLNNLNANRGENPSIASYRHLRLCRISGEAGMALQQSFAPNFGTHNDVESG
jgi:integrase